MKKILFPTDFSEASEKAFRYAHTLAADVGGQVDLLHVFHLPISDASSVPPEYIQEMLDEAEKDALNQLQSFSHEYKDAPTMGQLLTSYGLFTPVEIAEQGGEGNYDLIIMGTKGERGSLEKLMGSITTDVLMRSPCPVLAVPTNAEYKPVGHIAYATSFEPSDEHAVEDLMRIGGQLGAQVHFVHVNVKSNKGNIEDVQIQKDYPYHFTDFAVINNYSVMDGLDDYIQKRDMDWLALFIPNRRLLERLFHTSFTKRMTFHTSIPLLVFRE